MNKIFVEKLDKIDSRKILFDINGKKNFTYNGTRDKNMIFEKFPVSFDVYNNAFNKVYDELLKGNSFLLNLTFRTLINTNFSLLEIFYQSLAKYRLFYNNAFTIFSPEEFVCIKNNKIYSYPMKGTIDASVHDAKNILMGDEKEYAEHITIVDLIRNDLGMVAKNIKVNRFRYIDEISAGDKKLFQVSSEIEGELEIGWQEKIGTILTTLLPAGSVTGAPKKKTVEIIKKTEDYKRDYYTGIFGIFDGVNLDSAVMIRFIEKINDKMYYKSGGGITVYSDAEKEYREMIDKIYVPFN